uniref:Uncharacterized protein n=1 Tax=Arundo donax TaxID=35708 RepID=A0A0A9AG00_ARUDO
MFTYHEVLPVLKKRVNYTFLTASSCMH